MEEFVSCNVFNYQHEVYTKKKKINHIDHRVLFSSRKTILYRIERIKRLKPTYSLRFKI